MSSLEELSLLESRILVVDDQAANLELLRAVLRRMGYTQVEAASDPLSALRLFETHRPDIVLLDLHMPHMSGLELMAHFHKLSLDPVPVPVVILTADVDPTARQRALASGAHDFLTKPFDPTEVALRIRNLLTTRQLQMRLARHNLVLEEKVRERTADLERSQMEVLERLALAAEFRDDATLQHTRRVGKTSELIAHALGCEDQVVGTISLAAPLHDVGKISVPDEILLKTTPLAYEEFERIKSHTTVGAAILSESGFDVTQVAEVVALSHHERWDGTGYPAGLRGEEIPLEGRIVSVADVFDALTHERPYKAAWPVDEALDEIACQKGRQFDPRIVDIFLGLEAHEQLASA
jgi:putative two-component system response regulator